MSQVIRAFSELNAAGMLATQRRQITDKLIITDTVQAGTTKMCKTNVSNIGDFLCLWLTGSFETLYTVGGYVVDTGIDYLRGQLQDNGGQRKLFQDMIPFSLIMSGGRRRSASAMNSFKPVTISGDVVATAPASNPLFYPEEFEYLFAKSNDILFNVQNTSNTDLSFDLVFHGIRIFGNNVSGRG